MKFTLILLSTSLYLFGCAYPMNGDINQNEFIYNIDTEKIEKEDVFSKIDNLITNDFSDINSHTDKTLHLMDGRVINKSKENNIISGTAVIGKEYKDDDIRKLFHAYWLHMIFDFQFSIEENNCKIKVDNLYMMRSFVGQGATPQSYKATEKDFNFFINELEPFIENMKKFLKN